MITREEAIKLAQHVLDYHERLSVDTTRTLAMFVIHDEEDRAQLTNNLSSVQARCTELLEERRTLARLIEKIAAESSNDQRDALINEAVSAARGSQ